MKRTTIHSIVRPKPEDSDEPWLVGGALIVTVGMTLGLMILFIL